MSAMDANFQNAQLSQAAYAVGLVPGMAGQNDSAYSNRLKSDEVGMSDAQATRFSDNYGYWWYRSRRNCLRLPLHKRAY